MALLTHGTGRLLTPTGLEHVAARGRAAQAERQQTGRGENENDGDHEYEVHHRPAPIDRARMARSMSPERSDRHGMTDSFLFPDPFVRTRVRRADNRMAARHRVPEASEATMEAMPIIRP